MNNEGLTLQIPLQIHKEFIDKFPENQFVGDAKKNIEKPQSKKVEKTKKITTSPESQKEKHTNAIDQEITNKLKKLESFYKKGLIDEDEYREKRAEIIKEL